MNLAIRTLQLAGHESLSSDSARWLLANGGQLVDMRSPQDYRRDALPGSVNLPMDALSHDFGQLDRHEPVILCGVRDAACIRAACLLAGQGFSRIYHLHSA